jgi:hypothetical protein
MIFMVKFASLMIIYKYFRSIDFFMKNAIENVINQSENGLQTFTILGVDDFMISKRYERNV